MEGRATKQWSWCLLLLLIGCNSAFSQYSQLHNRLPEIPGIGVTQLPNSNFVEYYAVTIPQPLNHEEMGGESFSQRLFIGLRDLSAPVVLVTEGYGIDFATKPDHQHELSKELHANLIVVEHRFFGKSQPRTIDFQWLTVFQAAEDLHRVKTLLGAIFKGKWISAGSSKGGQAALAYRMRYPDDVVATVAYGTAVKKTNTVSTTALLDPLMGTPCGQKVAQFQLSCFQKRAQIFPEFVSQVAGMDLEFGDMELDVVLDYILLEFPFSFWQGGGECAAIPTKEDEVATQVAYLLKTVSPKYYTPATRRRWAPAYYMFYHELGYYEYDLEPFRAYLKQAAYPNQFFAPPGVEPKFDREFLESVRDFLDASAAAHSVFFIYGEMDPWALQSVVVRNKYVVPAGSHKSKIADLPIEVREELLRRLQRCLDAGNGPK